MQKELRCRDAGFDCDRVVRGKSDEEVMRQAAQHAREKHGITTLGEEDVRQIQSKIRTV
jgi:predicted small metal-binding protein